MSNLLKAISVIFTKIWGSNIFGWIPKILQSINFNKKEDKSVLLATIDLLNANESPAKQKLLDSLEVFFKRKRSKIYLAQQMHRVAKKIYTKGKPINSRDIVVLDAFFERESGISILKNPKAKDIKKIADQKQRQALILAQRLARGNITSEDVNDLLEIKLMYELEGKKRRAKYRKRKVKNLEENSYSISTFTTDNEIIKFYNSSWLDYAIYSFKYQTAKIKMIRSEKLYTFYWVPRSTIYLLQKLNGKFMWDGFGLWHSTRPMRWLRKK